MTPPCLRLAASLCLALCATTHAAPTDLNLSFRLDEREIRASVDRAAALLADAPDPAGSLVGLDRLSVKTENVRSRQNLDASFWLPLLFARTEPLGLSPSQLRAAVRASEDRLRVSFRTTATFSPQGRTALCACAKIDGSLGGAEAPRLERHEPHEPLSAAVEVELVPVHVTERNSRVSEGTFCGVTWEGSVRVVASLEERVTLLRALRGQWRGDVAPGEALDQAIGELVCRTLELLDQVPSLNAAAEGEPRRGAAELLGAQEFVVAERDERKLRFAEYALGKGKLVRMQRALTQVSPDSTRRRELERRLEARTRELERILAASRSLRTGGEPEVAKRLVASYHFDSARTWDQTAALELEFARVLHALGEAPKQQRELLGRALQHDRSLELDPDVQRLVQRVGAE